MDFKEGRFGFVSDKGDDDVIDKYGKIEIALARFPIRLFTDTFLFLFSENSERLILPFSPNTVIKKKMQTQLLFSDESLYKYLFLVKISTNIQWRNRSMYQIN